MQDFRNLIAEFQLIEPCTTEPSDAAQQMVDNNINDFYIKSP